MPVSRSVSKTSSVRLSTCAVTHPTTSELTNLSHQLWHRWAQLSTPQILCPQPWSLCCTISAKMTVRCLTRRPWLCIMHATHWLWRLLYELATLKSVYLQMWSHSSSIGITYLSFCSRLSLSWNWCSHRILNWTARPASKVLRIPSARANVNSSVSMTLKR